MSPHIAKPQFSHVKGFCEHQMLSPHPIVIPIQKKSSGLIAQFLFCLYTGKLITSGKNHRTTQLGTTRYPWVQSQLSPQYHSLITYFTCSFLNSSNILLSEHCKSPAFSSSHHSIPDLYIFSLNSCLPGSESAAFLPLTTHPPFLGMPSISSFAPTTCSLTNNLS